MSCNTTPEKPEDPIETALREFRAAWYGGKNPDVEDFCRGRSECGPELRARIENFLFVVQSLIRIKS